MSSCSIPIDIVVAHDLERGIGKDNALLWHLPEDMQYFKRLTTLSSGASKQSVVIMGRKTFESIPEAFRPLPGRLNIVVSRTKNYSGEGLQTVTSIQEAVDLAESWVQESRAEAVFCIGGGQIYKAMLKHPACRQIFVTEVQDTFNADTIFPSYVDSLKKIHESPVMLSKTGIKYRFCIFTKA